MSSVPNIVLVGAGKLGSRYLQGMAREIQEANVQVIDIFPESINNSMRILKEEKQKFPGFRVEFRNDYNSIFSSIDLCIISTTADCRFSVLEKLILHSRIKYLILEKVLFQKIEDYQNASILLAENKIITWVNCGRRAFKSYQWLAEEFITDPPLYFNVHGGEWGLSCNSIHFIDIMAFLTGSTIKSVSTLSLSKEMFPSKRKGFFEMNGKIEGLFENGSEITLVSDIRIKDSFIITVKSRSKTAIIDEIGGFVFIRYLGTPWIKELFQVPLLSQYIGKVVKDILRNGDCQLTKYEESRLLHEPFIKALNEYYHLQQCPIT